jgi:hypothetical protein
VFTSSRLVSRGYPRTERGYLLALVSCPGACWEDAHRSTQAGGRSQLAADNEGQAARPFQARPSEHGDLRWNWERSRMDDRRRGFFCGILPGGEPFSIYNRAVRYLTGVNRTGYQTSILGATTDYVQKMMEAEICHTAVRCEINRALDYCPFTPKTAPPASQPPCSPSAPAEALAFRLPD